LALSDCSLRFFGFHKSLVAGASAPNVGRIRATRVFPLSASARGTAWPNPFPVAFDFVNIPVGWPNNPAGFTLVSGGWLFEFFYSRLKSVNPPNKALETIGVGVFFFIHKLNLSQPA
jgi:hypothetical protein